MLTSFAALSTGLVFALLALLHLYWGARGKPPTSGAVLPELRGEAVIHPGRAATLGVALLLLTAAGLVTLQADLWRCPLVPGWIPRVGTWGVGAVLFARFVGDFRYVGIFKRVKGTRFAKLDTAFYAPLCLALCLGCVLAALRRT